MQIHEYFFLMSHAWVYEIKYWKESVRWARDKMKALKLFPEWVQEQIFLAIVENAP